MKKRIKIRIISSFDFIFSARYLKSITNEVTAFFDDVFKYTIFGAGILF